MVGRCLPEIDRYPYGTRPRVGAPKVSSHPDSIHERLLMGVVGKVRPWVPTPIHATNNFRIVVLASRIPDCRSYPFPVQWIHVWDTALVPSHGSQRMASPSSFEVIVDLRRRAISS